MSAKTIVVKAMIVNAWDYEFDQVLARTARTSFRRSLESYGSNASRLSRANCSGESEQSGTCNGSAA